MKKLNNAAILWVVLALASCTSSSTTGVADAQANPDARLLQDFKERLEAYVELRKKADDTAPPLKKTDNPEDIHIAQTSLADRIRASRPDAKHGDILTPEIAAYLRRLLRPELKEPETKEAILDDNPGTVPFKANGDYPEKAPLSTVPPQILAMLPMLPKDIEYRFVGRHLILRDTRANLIIDYVTNVLP